MALEEYKAFAGPLQFPINGKLYTMPELGIADGIRMETEESADTATGMTGAELRQLVLGDAYTQMLADNVPASAVDRALYAAIADIKLGRDAAEVMWNTGAADPKALAQMTNRASKRSTSTVAARTTKPRASTSGTKTSRKK